MSLVDELARSRIHFFTGKGGVGKSTVVAAAAIALAAQGKRPLIVELGHRATMSAILGAPSIGYEPREVAPGVRSMNLEPEAALREYVASRVKIPGFARFALASEPLRRFFEAAPAVNEVVTLAKLDRLEREQRGGRPKHDPILVDLDATGHALMFFELPRVFSGIARSGPLAALLDSFSALLRDERRAKLHVVTLPMELPVNETLELCEHLRPRGELSVGKVVVNRTPPAPPGDTEHPDPAERRLRERFSSRRERAAREIARLERAGLDLVLLPEVHATHDVQTRLEVLAASMEGAR